MLFCLCFLINEAFLVSLFWKFVAVVEWKTLCREGNVVCSVWAVLEEVKYKVWIVRRV